MNNEYIKDYRMDTYKDTLNLNSMEIEKHNVKIDILYEDPYKIYSFDSEQDDVYISKLTIEDDIHGFLKVENTARDTMNRIKLGLNYE